MICAKMLLKQLILSCVVLYNRYVVDGLQCHSCSGKQDCETLITQFPGRSGRCQIDLGNGKCFIRKDPNNVIYWGCIDDVFWPGVPWRSFNGCETDWDRGWEQDGMRRPMIWCFCAQDDCNVSIEKVNNTNWDELDRETTRPTASTQITTTTTAILSTLMSVATARPSSSTPVQSTPASCPSGFVVDSKGKSCYKVVSPTDSSRDLARGHDDAVSECRALGSHLMSIDSPEEHEFISTVLSSRPPMPVLDGWQGWWTAAKFVSGINQFIWFPYNRYLPSDSSLWGFLKIPLDNTCVWIMSISFYNYSLANYDCYTKAGYICEIEIA